MIVKRPYEEFTRYREFYRPDGLGWLELGETIITPYVIILDSNGVDQSVTMVGTISVQSNTQVKYKILGGISGGVYSILIRIITSLGNKYEDVIQLIVQ
jgi:hypothetical protein